MPQLSYADYVSLHSYYCLRLKGKYANPMAIYPRLNKNSSSDDMVAQLNAICADLNKA